MARLVTSIVLICLCLVTTGEVVARAVSLLPKAGVSHVRERATIALSVVDVVEETDNIDPWLPVATATIARECDRAALSTADARRLDIWLRSDEAPLYIAIRRLLI